MTTDTPNGGTRGSGTRALVGIIAAVAALGFAAIVVAVVIDHQDAQPRSAAAAETVEHFLQALADSDAETALSLLSEEPRETTFLTDDVLAASNALAPLDDIEVTASSHPDDSGFVSASYSLGDLSTTTMFRVEYRDRDEGWRISGGTSELYFDAGGNLNGLDLSLNGQPVESDYFVVFPGTYELSTTTRYIALSGSIVTTVQYPDDDVDASDIEAKLTDEGLNVFEDAVRTAVADCLSSKMLEADCGLSVTGLMMNGQMVQDGTITRTLGADAQATLDSLEPAYGYGHPLLVRGPSIGETKAVAPCVDDGKATECEIVYSPPLRTPIVDLSNDTVTVRWE